MWVMGVRRGMCRESAGRWVSGERVAGYKELVGRGVGSGGSSLSHVCSLGFIPDPFLSLVLC